jgi:hypothetical protein
MVGRSLTFSLVPLLPPSSRRAIGFLEDENDPSFDAKATFEGLSEKSDRLVRSRFSYWLEAGPPNDQWFHGWSGPKYKNCYVFKWDEHRIHHRMYGFLCHPVVVRPRFQVCALIFHDAKTEWETDYAMLDRINSLLQQTTVAVIQLAVVR